MLRASTLHRTAALDVALIGTGLSAVQSVRVGASDDVWSVPLAITARTPTSLQATADVYAALPAAVVQTDGVEQTAALAPVPAEAPPLAQLLSAGPDTIFFRDPNPGVFPKDFSFSFNSVPDPLNPNGAWKGIFHLFYIRNVRATHADSIIGHAWTDSLGKPWQLDTLAFRPSGQGWDGSKVWAPSIQQVGNLYYMFYTGVDANGDQSTGFATTPMLGLSNITWTRSASPAYRPFDAASWADTIGHQVSGQLQFRDPFVMPDPDQAQWPGRYLMFMAGEDRDLHPRYTIGVARNTPGTLGSWQTLDNYSATDAAHLAVTGSLESPTVVRDSLSGAWRMFVANADYHGALGEDATIFLTGIPGDSLTNTSAAAWPGRDTLFSFLGNDGDVVAWQACEHLQIGQVHYFAGYQGNGIGVTRMHWDPATQRFFIAPPSVADAGRPTGAPAFTFARIGAPLRIP